jgi:hypothetical protein
MKRMDAGAKMHTSFDSSHLSLPVALCYSTLFVVPTIVWLVLQEFETTTSLSHHFSLRLIELAGIEELAGVAVA